MDNGRNLIDMVCEAFESTEEEETEQGGSGGSGNGGLEEAEPQACFNFSEHLHHACCCCQCACPAGHAGQMGIRLCAYALWRRAAIHMCGLAPAPLPARLLPTGRHLPRAAAAQARPAGVCRCCPRLWSQVCRGAVCGNPGWIPAGGALPPPHAGECCFSLRVLAEWAELADGRAGRQLRLCSAGAQQTNLPISPETAPA